MIRLVYSLLYCVSKSTFTPITGLLGKGSEIAGTATWYSAPDRLLVLCSGCSPAGY